MPVSYTHLDYCSLVYNFFRIGIHPRVVTDYSSGYNGVSSGNTVSDYFEVWSIYNLHGVYNYWVGCPHLLYYSDYRGNYNGYYPDNYYSCLLYTSRCV